MSASYPTTPRTFTSKTNKVDTVDASHINLLQDEVNATETYLGTNPQGSHGSLTARLAVMHDTNGCFYGSTAFPDGAGAPSYPRQGFYRNDTDVFYIRNAANTGWNAIGASLSNVLLQWHGHYGDNLRIGTTRFAGSTPVNEYISTTVGAVDSATAFHAKWIKVQGINSITAKAGIWTYSNSAGNQSKIWVKIGTATAATAIGAANMTTPEWVTSSAIDVSALTNGATYDVLVTLSNTGVAGGTAALGGVVLFGA